MGKNAKAATQRAKKKQQKDKARRLKNQAEKQRRQSVAALPPGGRGANRHGLPSYASPVWDPAAEGILGLARHDDVHPHAAARSVFDQAELYENDLPDALWTLEKVADLGTEAILAGLEDRGVHADEVAFVERARLLGSAWKLAEALWAPALPEPASAHDRDFLGLAAYTLWKRWCPEVPSLEAVIDRLGDGMEALEDDEQAIAAARWIEAWDCMKPLLTSETRTFEAAEDLLDLRESLFDWAESLAMVAKNTALTDAGVAVRASRVIEDVLAQFSGEDGEVRRSLSGDLGTLLFRAGRPEDGERVLRELIAATPDCAEGYVTLADAWPECRADQERSLALLVEAAARVEDGEDWDLEPRIEALRAALATPVA